MIGQIEKVGHEIKNVGPKWRSSIFVAVTGIEFCFVGRKVNHDHVIRLTAALIYMLSMLWLLLQYFMLKISESYRPQEQNFSPQGSELVSKN